MNLEARKIEFVQEFLKIQSEEVISLLENILKIEKENLNVQLSEPMSEYELNQRINQSESDFQNNLFKTSSALTEKYKK